jgi:hypothetical protein
VVEARDQAKEKECTGGALEESKNRAEKMRHEREGTYRPGIQSSPPSSRKRTSSPTMKGCEN